jgi:hypothetical protein
MTSTSAAAPPAASAAAVAADSWSARIRVDDGYVARQQQRVHRPVAARRGLVVVDRVVGGERDARGGQPQRRLGGQVGVLRRAVCLGAEVHVPPGAHEHGVPGDVEAHERRQPAEHRRGHHQRAQRGQDDLLGEECFT